MALAVFYYIFVINKTKIIMLVRDRDIIFLDVETSGLNKDLDKIVEICLKKVKINGEVELKTKRFKVDVKIEDSATLKHKITNEDLVNEQPFSRYANGILKFLENSAIVSYNGRMFDFIILYNEFQRCNLQWDYLNVPLIDPYSLWNINESRNLENAFKRFTGKTVDKNLTHSAEYDTFLLENVFNSLVNEFYSTETITLEELAYKSNYDKKYFDINGVFYLDKDNNARYGFGSVKDKTVSEAPWQLDYIIKGNYSSQTKTIAEFLKAQLGNDGK